MIAKLFDQISVSSLLNAVGFSLLLHLSMLWLPSPAPDLLPQPAEFTWLFKALTIVVGFIAVLIFNENNNRSRRFDGHNHLLVVTSCLALVLLHYNDFAEAPFLMLAAILWLIKLKRLLDFKDTRYLYFELGLLVGFFTFLSGGLIFLLPISWILGIMLSQLNGRAWLASVLGAAAMSYLLVAVSAWFGWDLWSHLISELRGIELFWRPGEFLVYSSVLPLGFLFLVALVYFPSLVNRANNFQRSALTFWYSFMLMSLAAWALLENKLYWAAFLSLSLGWILALIIANGSNKWWRSFLYLLLFTAVGLALTFRLGLITF